MNAEDLLPIALAGAVPLWIEEFKRLPWADVLNRRDTALELITSKGDLILFNAHKRGETAQAFNALAQALAILAFAPGGVKAFQSHWEAVHPETVAG